MAKTKEKGLLRVKASLKDEPEDGTFESEFMIQLTDTADGLGTRLEYRGAPAGNRTEAQLRDKAKGELKAAGDWRSVTQIAKALNVSKPTARDALNSLFDLKLAQKEQRGQAFFYKWETVESVGGLQ